MELQELLGISPGVTALIGGGGKTTMMYALARELSRRGTVICTTTTHIRPPDHLPVLERVDRAGVERARCVCAGRPTAEGKLTASEILGDFSWTIPHAKSLNGDYAPVPPTCPALE